MTDNEKTKDSMDRAFEQYKASSLGGGQKKGDPSYLSSFVSDDINKGLTIVILQDHINHIKELATKYSSVTYDPSVLTIDPKGNLQAQLARILIVKSDVEREAAAEEEEECADLVDTVVKGVKHVCNWFSSNHDHNKHNKKPTKKELEFAHNVAEASLGLFHNQHNLPQVAAGHKQIEQQPTLT